MSLKAKSIRITMLGSLMVVGLEPTAALAQVPPAAPAPVSAQTLRIREVVLLKTSGLGGTAAGGSVSPEVVGISYGQGYNPFTGSPRGRCVVYNGESDLMPTSGAGGQTTDFRIVEIEDTEKFHSAMNLNAAASFGFGPFAADISAQYASDRKISTYSNSLVAAVKVRNETKSLKAFVLTDPAAKALQQDPDAFFRMCGTYFMAGLVTGGDFAVVMRISSRDDEEQRTNRAALEASYGMYGSVSVQFDQAMQRLITKGALQAEIIRKGSRDAVPALTPADVRAYALNYPQQVSNTGGAPWPIEAIMIDYAVVDARARTFRAEELYLSGLASELAAAYQLRNDLLYVQSNVSEFLDVNLPAITTDLSRVQAAIASIKSKANACSADPAANCTGTIPITPAVTLPARLPWKAIDPKKAARECLGTVAPGQKKFLRMEGRWTAWDDKREWFDVNSLEIHYVRVSDNKDLSETRYPMFAMPLPDLGVVYQVCVRVKDSTYTDNHADNLRAVIISAGADKRYNASNTTGRGARMLIP